MKGRIVKGLAGLYEIRLDGGERVSCKARGVFRHEGLTPLVGDFVTLENDGGNYIISDIHDRKNSLIRPPLANLDYLFCFVPCAKPAPVYATVDKLIAIAEHNGIEPVIVVSKSDLSSDMSDEIRGIYERCGFAVICVSNESGEGVEKIRDYLENTVRSGTAAFAGASGVGKSTLMNSLFPSLSLETGALSRKVERGKHTTRHVELYYAGEFDGCDMECVIADTPGFSMLDFVRFDFFDKEALPQNFREFSRFIPECKYRGCTHIAEEGCAVIAAVENGDIPRSRYESFSGIYNDIKDKRAWNSKI